MIYNHSSKSGGWTYQKTSIYACFIQFLYQNSHIGYFCTENFTPPPTGVFITNNMVIAHVATLYIEFFDVTVALVLATIWLQKVGEHLLENIWYFQCVKWTKLLTRQQDRLLIKVTHPVL